jgi:hypothetical protein
MAWVPEFTVLQGSASRDHRSGERSWLVVSRKDWASLVPDQADGALSSAAVLRVGLGPTTPPLCRYAKCTADLISPVWRAFSRCAPTKTDTGNTPGLSPLHAHPVRCPDAWGEWRSGIKEEAAALGRNGGQPRSQSPQVPGRRSANPSKRTNVPTQQHVELQSTL